jgi:site-specific recombinase XerD
MDELMNKFLLAMKVRGFASSTQTTYCGELRKFFKELKGKDPREVTIDDVVQFQSRLVDQKLSAQTINLRMAVIRLFFLKVLQRNWPDDFAPWFKARRKLPVLFSKEEVAALINATTSIKQRTIFITIYSTGMRSCEIRRLTAKDIDSARMLIKVKGKGNKERFVPLSKNLLFALRRYWVECKDNKTLWLFPGMGERWNKPYSAESIKSSFQKAKRRADIDKPGGVHVLRHCYATHLLESGVEMRIIQILLGHSSIRSTEIYTHLTNRHAREIKSPLDTIFSLIKR